MAELAREWTLRLPFRTPLSLNDRGHWSTTYRVKKAWKDTAIVLARAQKIPRLERFTVVLHYAPRARRLRDLDNLVASTKPLVDGLVIAGVCDGDDADRYVPTNPVLEPATGEPGRLWLVVRELLLPGSSAQV